MRIPTNLVAASLASLIAYGGWQLIQGDIESSRREAATRKERIRFAAELRVRSALAGAATSTSGWVHEVNPDWFRAIPRNHLLPGSHSWLEIATPDQARLRHPMKRTADGPDEAAWWYNPATGDLRARVPTHGSHEAAKTLYAIVNN